MTLDASVSVFRSTLISESSIFLITLKLSSSILIYIKHVILVCRTVRLESDIANAHVMQTWMNVNMNMNVVQF